MAFKLIIQVEFYYSNSKKKCFYTLDNTIKSDFLVSTILTEKMAKLKKLYQISRWAMGYSVLYRQTIDKSSSLILSQLITELLN